MAINRDPKAFGTHSTTMIEEDRLAQGLNLPPFVDKSKFENEVHHCSKSEGHTSRMCRRKQRAAKQNQNGCDLSFDNQDVMERWSMLGRGMMCARMAAPLRK